MLYLCRLSRLDGSNDSLADYSRRPLSVHLKKPNSKRDNILESLLKDRNIKHYFI